MQGTVSLLPQPGSTTPALPLHFQTSSAASQTPATLKEPQTKIAMKIPNRIRTIRNTLNGLLAALIVAHTAHAADGTWTTSSGGSWDTGVNWATTNIADGTGFTANFNTLNLN